uniref:Uncharacterized protein n=1 Tax=Vespula pensylvanica TaxID=30213 RepID=A0A834P934_VESPE|nr:hypothetical protein H0235_004814 [Vespula pensylvanica]
MEWIRVTAARTGRNSFVSTNGIAKKEFRWCKLTLMAFRNCGNVTLLLLLYYYCYNTTTTFAAAPAAATATAAAAAASDAAGAAAAAAED